MGKTPLGTPAAVSEPALLVDDKNSVHLDRKAVTVPANGKGKKRKKVVLTLKIKNDIISLIEKGVSVAKISDHFKIGKSTVRDILKKKTEIRSAELSPSKKTLRASKHVDIEDAVLKWCEQQRSSGITVRGPELRSAALKFAERFGCSDFKGSEGWLWRFRRRHNMRNGRVKAETMNADIPPSDRSFQEKLKSLISLTGLSKSQLYNADETGLFWKSLPHNTKASKDDDSVPGCKTAKERLSALLCANADGSNRMKPVIVGNVEALNNAINLPSIYYNSEKARFTHAVFEDWFHHHFVPEVRRFQENRETRKENIQAVLILDNAPVHPAGLCSDDGRIRCIFLPPNTTIQPMDQGIIEATKRLYRKKMLEEVLYDEANGNVAGQTLQNLKTYTVKSAIFNWDRAWRDVRQATLIHGWDKILQDQTDIEVDEPENLAANNFREILASAGENGVSNDDVEEWLEEDMEDPGYHFLTGEEAPVTKRPRVSEEEESDVERITLKDVRDSLDMLLRFIDSSDEAVFQHFFLPIRLFREEVVRKEQGVKKTSFASKPGTSSS